MRRAGDPVYASAMGRLRIATWNVLADAYLDPAQYPRTPAKLLAAGARRGRIRDDILAMVEALRLDVVCLQEADEALAAAIGDATPSSWGTCWSPRPGGGDGCLSLVCGGWQPLGSEAGMYHSAPGVPVQRLTLSDGDDAVAVYHTHLRWADDEGATCRAQAAELAALAGDESLPTVVVGDLNAPPDSATVAELRDAGFHDAHTDHSLRTAVFSHTGPLRLDYILVRCATAQPLSANGGRQRRGAFPRARDGVRSCAACRTGDGWAGR